MQGSALPFGDVTLFFHISQVLDNLDSLELNEFAERSISGLTLQYEFQIK